MDTANSKQSSVVVLLDVASQILVIGPSQGAHFLAGVIVSQKPVNGIMADVLPNGHQSALSLSIIIGINSEDNIRSQDIMKRQKVKASSNSHHSLVSHKDSSVLIQDPHILSMFASKGEPLDLDTSPKNVHVTPDHSNAVRTYNISIENTFIDVQPEQSPVPVNTEQHNSVHNLIEIACVTVGVQSVGETSDVSSQITSIQGKIKSNTQPGLHGIPSLHPGSVQSFKVNLDPIGTFDHVLLTVREPTIDLISGPFDLVDTLACPAPYNGITIGLDELIEPLSHGQLSVITLRLEPEKQIKSTVATLMVERRSVRGNMDGKRVDFLLNLVGVELIEKKSNEALRFAVGATGVTAISVATPGPEVVPPPPGGPITVKRRKGVVGSTVLDVIEIKPAEYSQPGQLWQTTSPAGRQVTPPRVLGEGTQKRSRTHAPTIYKPRS